MDDAYVSRILSEIQTYCVCHVSLERFCRCTIEDYSNFVFPPQPFPHHCANQLAVKMLIVVTVHSPINAPVIQEQLVILTKHVDPNERHRVVKHHVALALNVVKMAYLLIVFVHPAISAIHLSSVMTLMNVQTELVVKEQFVSTHQEATIANANQDLLG